MARVSARQDKSRTKMANVSIASVSDHCYPQCDYLQILSEGKSFTVTDHNVQKAIW